MASAKRIKKRIYRMYGSCDTDWMGYAITEENFATRHHITKRADCFPTSNNKIKNSAILGRISHNLLNYLESNYEYLYDSWNELFRDIVDSKKMTQQIIQRMFELRQKTEYLIITDTNVSQQQREYFKKIFILDDNKLENYNLDFEYSCYDNMPNRECKKMIIHKRKK